MNMQPNTLAAPPEPITIKQWAELDRDAGFDLVEGRLQEKPPVALWHEILLTDLTVLLAAYIKSHALGRIVTSKARLRISDVGGREPDLFFIPTDQFHLAGRIMFRGTPPLVTEILSPTTEHIDRTDKRDEYAQLGVGQYWLIDFPNRTVEVYSLRTPTDRESYYELAETVIGDGVFRPSLFPGLEIPLTEIWPTEFENRTDN
jgi:Uma2 family endonuclease